MKQVLLAIGALLTASCGAIEQPQNAAPVLDSRSIALHSCPEAVGRPRLVSVAQLAASPDAFHGVLVRVSGHYHHDFEHSAIYSAPAPDPDAHQFADGIWLLRMPPEFRGDRMEVTGYFTAKTKGHLGQWPGSLCVISVAGASQHAP